MWIPRDLEKPWSTGSSLPARILTGVRQCGKTSLLEHLVPQGWNVLSLDDFQLRSLAQRDPALFFDMNPLPAIIDEIQYAPDLFPEIKRRVDKWRRERREGTEGRSPLVWASGSNQILIDRKVKESLAGRASYYTLHTLSVGEIARAFPRSSLDAVFLKGGWPELYLDERLSPAAYLNDHIRSFVEKDIVLSAGIQKVETFAQALALLAARTGTLLNASSISQESGVQVSTILDWVGILERTHLIHRLQPWHSNLSKRVLKTPKLYFLDVGLAARLQGWSDPAPLLRSPQAGPLFETLVFSEIMKTRDHFLKDWQLFHWRTREKEEVDFIVRNSAGKTIALEAKLATQSIGHVELPAGFQRDLPEVDQLVVVAFGGEQRSVSRRCVQLPIARLAEFLLERL
jgi:predicted AAA+ superfamily ATPase